MKYLIEAQSLLHVNGTHTSGAEFHSFLKIIKRKSFTITVVRKHLKWSVAYYGDKM